MMNMPRSSFYKIAKENSPQVQKENADLRDKIEHIILMFPGYGYRRVTKQLQREGREINHKKVLRIMRKEDLLCSLKRKFKVITTNSNHSYPRYPNLAKELVLGKINQLWVADITYIRINQGFVYLAVILDAFSRRVVGYALSENIDTELVLAALRVAIRIRNPQKGCIHHSDQGIQYASHAYTDLLKENGFEISMSRRGNCYDNAKAESFFKTLKREEVYLWEYQTFEDAQKRICYFIEDVYNKKRLHSSLDYLPPIEFEDLTREAEKQSRQAVLINA